MYNVLTKLRGGDPLTAKEKPIHEQGLVSVLQKLHDDLDRAVLEAYGWSDIEIGYAPGEHIGTSYGDVSGPGESPPEDYGELWNSAKEALLTRLAALNKERAAEETAGHIRHLRPDFQNPGMVSPRSPGMALRLPGASTQPSLDLPDASPSPKAKSQKLPWPQDLPSQATALRQLLATYPQGATVPQLAARFTKAPKSTLTQLLETIAALGQATRDGETYRSS